MKNKKLKLLFILGCGITQLYWSPFSIANVQETQKKRESNIPALLEFAGSYKSSTPNSEQENKQPQFDSLLKQSRNTEVQLQQQRASIQVLQRQLNALKEEKKHSASTKLNQPQEQQKITDLQQELKKLTQDLEANKNINSELQAQVTALAGSVNEKEKVVTDVNQKLLGLKNELASSKPTVKEKIPVSKTEIRDYAVGTSLGNDILSLLQERASNGIEVDQSLVLAGVIDTFGSEYKLSKEILGKALYESSIEVENKENKIKSDNELAGKKYIQQFEKKKDVKKSPSGFYYRIDYSGAGIISAEDMVSVSMKESLTNGKVIKDMDLSDHYISQKISAYPPIFQEAIKLLQNHGSITMVVPPELAYGDKGYPPEIKPGATMVYSLRIIDVTKK